MKKRRTQRRNEKSWTKQRQQKKHIYLDLAVYQRCFEVVKSYGEGVKHVPVPSLFVCSLEDAATASVAIKDSQIVVCTRTPLNSLPRDKVCRFHTIVSLLATARSSSTARVCRIICRSSAGHVGLSSMIVLGKVRSPKTLWSIPLCVHMAWNDERLFYHGRGREGWKGW